MTITTTLARCADLGVHLSLTDDGRLKVGAAKGVVDAALRDELAAHKEALVDWLRAAAASRDDGPAPSRLATGGPQPLSHAQQRLWILDRIDPGNAAYTIASAFRLRGDLDVDALVAATRAIVARHDSLRTHFRQVDGVPYQIVSDAADVDVRYVDLSDAPSTLDMALAEETGTGFDLERGPLLRLRVYRLAAHDHAVYVAMHHIVGDGWSNGVFVGELTAHYAAIRAGNAAADLPPLALQYADYALWQKRYLDDARKTRLVAHWRERLSGSQALDLPLDAPRPARPTLRGARASTRIDADAAQALRRVGRERGGTLFTAALAAFYVLLRRYSGQHDIAIGTDVANRTRKEWEGLIGFFVNQLVLRADLSGNPAFADLVDRVHRVSLDAYANQELPFDVVVDELLHGREFSVSPFFTVKFILQNTPDSRPGAAGDDGVVFDALPLDHAHAKFDMTWSLVERGGGLDIDVEYSRELFGAATIDSYLDHYAELVARFAASPSSRIDDVAVGAARTGALVDAARRSQAAHGRDALHLGGMVERWAAHTPGAIAAVEGERSITYRELDAQANRLARHLADWGVGAETPVGVCLGASIDYAIAVVAISKAGGALVAIDPSYPEERIAHILDATGLQVLVSADAVLDRLPAYHLNFLGVVDIGERAAWASQPTDALGLPVHPDQLAYLIFTSGTTGKPKGVMVGCSGLNNLALAQGARFGLAPGKRVLQFASIGFDASVWEFVMAFGHGATLVCAPRDSVMPGQDLARTIAAHGVTHVTLPPSALAVMPETVADALDVLVLAGEASKDEVVRRWGDRTALFNAYGPSETTICASVEPYDAARGGFGGSIGAAIEGCGLYVIDAGGRLAPPGAPGELGIAGAALGRGYWNDPVQTALRFVPDAWSGVPGARVYRSGDKARQRDDGRVEFLGRIDQQVKIRGHRVELAEIESELARQPGVREAVVVTGGAPLELYAYVVAPVPTFDEAALKKALRRRLPEYMIPRAIVAIERVPTTSNGKIDKAALPPPETTRVLDASDRPSNAIEETLASIWRAVLGVDAVGTRDNFFDIGGHSLLLIQVQERVAETLQAEISVADLFKYPTLHSLAEFLGDGERVDRHTATDARVARRVDAGRDRSRRREARTAGAVND